MKNDYIDNQRQIRLQKLIANASIMRRIKFKVLGLCNTLPISSVDGVGVGVSKHADGHAHSAFLGLAKCNNPWCCPICSAVIIRHKREQLTSIITRLKREKNLVPIMVTFTIPHNVTQSAKSVYNRLRDVRRYAKNGIRYFLRKNGFTDGAQYSFQSTECKYSNHHGWHFHMHNLYWVKADRADDFMTDAVEAELTEIWTAAQTRQGEYEYNQSVADQAYFHTTAKPVHISRHVIENGNYLAKEMCKKTNGSHYSVDPIELIDSENPEDTEKFFEFAEAVARTRRFSQSKGLLRFADDEATLKKNAQTACGIVETSVVCTFTYSQWFDLLHSDESGEHRINILNIAPEGFDAIFFYCQEHNLPLPTRWERKPRGEPQDRRYAV